ncbi:glycosyl transferase group 1 [Fructilactobacillus fructivorans]|uniref:glycosyltransferase family 4 protein n=1 Tax=Fructilactobacillus fructivorans TaxID=1614 RepID=UPI0007052D4C|nr:glycosyltransferase family 4 protein [Fructilactobacillus fructivorans]KRN12943.1 glycosyl transferase group 1 [Fructilactobacillus fructivorans]
MKIAFVSEDKLNDVSVWSGTTSNIYDVISKRNEVVSVRPSGIKLFCGKVIRKFTKWFKLPDLEAFSDEWIAKVEGKSLSQKLKSHSDVDFIFVAAEDNLIEFLHTDIPIVFLNDATFNEMINYYWFHLTKKQINIHTRMDQTTLDKSALILMASEWAKNDAVQTYGINESKVKVLPFGANLPDQFVPHQLEADDKVKLLFVGVEWERKGMDVICSMMDKLNEKYPHQFEINAIGLNGLDDQKFPDNIKFHGFVSKHTDAGLGKMIKIYNESDIFVLPTKAECAGIAFAEASEYGLPSITYDTGGIGTYVINDYSGYRLNRSATAMDFADTVSDLANDHEKLVKMSKNARRLYKTKLNWDAWEHGFNKLTHKFDN